MTTAKDLFILAMDQDPERAVGQGDLSLALAGAELIDLLGAEAVTVDDDRVVPGGSAEPGDRLLGEAVAGLTRQAPYERIEDWLWRRGRDLSAGYRTALEEDGELAPKRGGRMPFGRQRVEPLDTPARRRAAERWEEREPVLTALASALGIGVAAPAPAPAPADDAAEGEDADEREFAVIEPGFEDEAVTAVVAAVHDAVMELEAVRQRRTIEASAFANLWRGV
ncbi:GPP34 family phosphoprotein [Streptomyces sp. R302]|uniref:GOLPH3/VPS74 family protein n=1 Tax=unclassified Streptomyces TaxID=2593676 RepID=UPI00145FAFB3|nr:MULTISPECIES: GPP34 family phosphoprotein [unclassified Streptomyces]NML53723.1 GPP34 family phosphoprotein [Streptomyces sp. R301]NML82982.1 GPP34 family phosphoprotein [Streptomyces sp. R302]